MLAMNTLSRRDFLCLSTKLAGLMGLGLAYGPGFAKGLEKLASGRAPVLWLQGQSCSGCSVSLLDSEPLSPEHLLTQYISLGFHQTLSAATGEHAVTVVNRMIEQGGYILIVEGSVPAGMPSACMFGEETFESQLERAARKAKAVVALGACACSGGIPAAENNPTGAQSVGDFLKARNITPPLINIPGCPAHPDWLVGTVVHVLEFGIPALDPHNRPRAFFGRLIHDECPRFADYEREQFAKNFGEPGCYFKLGCQGPITHADCNLRQWNGGTNACIRAGAPCAGCARPEFARQKDFPFYTYPIKQTTETKMQGKKEAQS